MNKMYEIREYYDSEGKSTKSEMVDLNNKYNDLREALEKIDDKTSPGDTNKPSKLKLLKKLTEDLTIEEPSYDQDQQSQLVRELEKLGRLSVELTDDKKLSLRDDLSFFDDLEGLEFEEDRRLSQQHIRQREKELEQIFTNDEEEQGNNTVNSISTQMSKSSLSSSSFSTSSRGWKKGFFNTSSKGTSKSTNSNTSSSSSLSSSYANTTTSSSTISTSSHSGKKSTLPVIHEDTTTDINDDLDGTTTTTTPTPTTTTVELPTLAKVSITNTSSHSSPTTTSTTIQSSKDTHVKEREGLNQESRKIKTTTTENVTKITNIPSKKFIPRTYTKNGISSNNSNTMRPISDKVIERFP